MLIKYIGDYNDLTDNLKYDVHLIGMIIEFVRLKLDDYVDYKKSIDEANNIEDDKKLIEMSYNEKSNLFKYIMINSRLCGGYISEMILVHIYTVIEEYLNKICSLLVTQKEIVDVIKRNRCSNILAYKLILDEKNIKKANKKYFQDVEVLRKIRNAIVHNRGEMKNKEVELVNKYVLVDDINNVYISIDDVDKFLSLFEKYISNIFEEINLKIK